jgi:prophage antirepressor-like protein
MPDAGVFQDWVCEDVIPTLRKKGRYQIGPPEAQAPATIVNRQLTVLIESMVRRDDQFERLLVANTVEPEVSESKDIIPHEFAFKGNPVRITTVENGGVMFRGGNVCKVLGGILTRTTPDGKLMGTLES